MEIPAIAVNIALTGIRMHYLLSQSNNTYPANIT
jgi:hypothetical protein